jgi:hypothetical protein
MCISIRGILHNYNTDKKIEKLFKGCLTDDNGKVITNGRLIREYFLDELSKGKEVLPMGKCDNFDFKKGCLGHRKNKNRIF